jgi:hypothetical protein
LKSSFGQFFGKIPQAFFSEQVQFKDNRPVFGVMRVWRVFAKSFVLSTEGGNRTHTPRKGPRILSTFMLFCYKP